MILSNSDLFIVLKAFHIISDLNTYLHEEILVSFFTNVALKYTLLVKYCNNENILSKVLPIRFKFFVKFPFFYSKNKVASEINLTSSSVGGPKKHT